MNNKAIELLAWLENWYASKCDGMWEHDDRIYISTLNNPGWRVKINLLDTYLMNKIVHTVKLEKSEDNWIYYWVKDNNFEAAGGPQNLIEMLEIFRHWAEYGII